MDAVPPSRKLSRQDWLTLGEQRLSRDGPGALSLDRLTAAAGRTKGSFYHHFQSRDDFLAALVDHWRGTVVAPAARPYRDGPTAWPALLHAAPFDLNQPFERALRRLAADEPIVRAGVERVDRERIDNLTFLVSQLRGDLQDPRAFAALMYAVIVGAQWLLKGPDDPRAPSLRQMFEAVFPLAPRRAG